MNILIIYVVHEIITTCIRRIRKYSSLEKAKQIVNLVMPHWYGCFAEKKQYLKIQKIHCKSLKVVYNSNKNYNELLRDNNEVSIHQSHLRALICAVFKSLNSLSPEFL